MSKLLFLITLFLTVQMESCNESVSAENVIIGSWTLDSVFLSDAIDTPCGWEAGEHEPLTLDISKTDVAYSFGGNSAVNSFFGSFEILSFDTETNQGLLKVDPIGSTRKAGPKPLMNCEQRYLNFIESANDFVFTSEGDLHLGNLKKSESHPRDGGKYLIFKMTE